MAGIDLPTAQANLTSWLAANTAVAGGQSYSIGGRSLSRVNASEILKQIEFWDNKVQELSRPTRGMRVRYGAPQ